MKSIHGRTGIIEGAGAWIAANPQESIPAVVKAWQNVTWRKELLESIVDDSSKVSVHSAAALLRCLYITKSQYEDLVRVVEGVFPSYATVAAYLNSMELPETRKVAQGRGHTVINAGDTLFCDVLTRLENAHAAGTSLWKWFSSNEVCTLTIEAMTN